MLTKAIPDVEIFSVRLFAIWF